MMESGNDGYGSNSESDGDICVKISKFMKNNDYSAKPVVDIVEADPIKFVESSACNEDFDDDELDDLLEEQILLKKIKCLKEYRQSLACYRDPELDKVDHHIKRKIENNDGGKNSQFSIDNDACDNDSILDDKKILECISNTEITDSEQLFERQNCFESLKKISKASSINVLMQSELTTLESVLMERLKEVVKEQIEVRAEISRLKLLEKSNVSKKPRKAFWYTLFGRPYFKDEQRYTCPKNEDAKLMKFKNQILTINLFQSRPWRIKEKYSLEESVRKILIEEEANKFYEKEKQLKNQLKENTVCSANVKKKVRSELQCINNKLELLQSKSIKELFFACAPNREFDWLKIAAKDIPNHSSEECQRMWHLYVKPSVNKNRFTNAEDSNLNMLIEKFGEQNWDVIVKKLGTSRSELLCFFNYKIRLKKGMNNTGKWTKEEDEKLLIIVKDLRIGDFIPWPKVAFYFEGRSLQQLYSRWTNSLNPDIKKGRFNKIEDRLILSYAKKYGENFNKISRLLGYRNSTQVRQRYLLTKMIKNNVGRWSLDEDEMLLALVEKYGVSRWSDISKQLVTRTRTQIRHRYRVIKNFMKKHPGYRIADIHRGPSARSQDLIPDGADEVKAACKEQENKLLSELIKDSKTKKRLPLNIASTKQKKGRKKRLERSKLDLKLMAYFKECFSSDKLKLRTHYVKPDINKAASALMLFCCYLKTSLILSGAEFDEAIKKLPNTLKRVVLRIVEDERGCDNLKIKFVDVTTNSVTSNSNDCVSVNRDKLFIDYLPIDPRETLVRDCDYLLSYKKVESELDELTINCKRSTTSNVIPYFLPPNIITMIGCRSIMLIKGKILTSLAHKCTKLSYFFPNDASLMKKKNLKLFTGYFSDDESVSDCDEKINNENHGLSNEKEFPKLLFDLKKPLTFSPYDANVSVPATLPMTRLFSFPNVDQRLSVASESLCTNNETVHPLPSTSEVSGPASPPLLFSDTPILYELESDHHTHNKCEDKVLTIAANRLTKREAIDLWKERIMVLFGWPLALANHVPDFSTSENENITNEMKQSEEPHHKNNTESTSNCMSPVQSSIKGLNPEKSNFSQGCQLIDNEKQSKLQPHGTSVCKDNRFKNKCVPNKEKFSKIAANQVPLTSDVAEVEHRQIINQSSCIKNKLRNVRKTRLSEIVSDGSNMSQNLDKITVDNSVTQVPLSDEPLDLKPKRRRKSNKRLEEFEVYK